MPVLQPEKKRTTIKDIAVAANVTPATVSSILNNKKLPFRSETVEKIKRLAKEMGYVTNTLARGLVQGRTNTIGIVFIGNTEQPFASPFLLQLISGICGVLNQAQYSVYFAPPPHIMSNEDLVSFLNSIFLSGRVDGCIMIGPHRVEFHSYLSALRYNTPFVLVGRIPNTTRMNMVDVNNESVGHQAIRHLLSRGAQSIACFTTDLLFQFANDRATGVKAALIEAGIHDVEDRVINTGDLSIKQLKDLILDLKKKWGSLDGLYLMNHSYPNLLHLMSALEELGISIPKDIKIIEDEEGNSQMFSPTLSAVKLDSKKIGEESARLMLESLDRGNPGFSQFFVEPEIIVRGST